MSVNKVILLGNVGREPEIRRTEDGNVCASFPLATSERAYRKRSGEEVPEKTEWHNIVAWQGVAERVERQLHRGSFVYLEGKLRSRQWIDQSNVRHYITEIFVDQFELLKNPSNANNNANESSSPADDAGNPA
ncbi:MAG: single-stranded DNA-binding protein [Bacteroidales bacterium]|jgi:single-strand DNA-binding protein|nr:single-stranded DNA-binding protein [Bacteroidales bacterium]MCR5360832.1 single-stranded DNA-binding protein [Bacteroidales bacterium]